MALRLGDISWRFMDNREWREHFRSWPPVILSCAISGKEKTKKDNSNIPESPEEQAESAYQAYKAGASIVHLVARDPKTKYSTESSDGTDFYQVNKLVRERCPDVIINNTAEPTVMMDASEKISSFFKNGKAEMVSMVCGAIINEAEGDKPETFIPAGWAKTVMITQVLKEQGIKVELGVHSSQSWWFLDNLIIQKTIEPPYLVLMLAGWPGASSPPNPLSTMELINDLPAGSIFSTGGVGEIQSPINALSLMLGGHIRVGLGDNIFSAPRKKAKSNAELVEIAVRLIQEVNRTVATPAQAREMLQMSAKPSSY